MIKNKPTLIFDFDGTIADTHHYIIAISNRIANEFGYAQILPEEIVSLKDKTAIDVIKHLKVPLLKIPAIIARAKKEFENDIADLKPFEGLDNALATLKDTGTQIGILSSNAMNNIQTFLTNHNLDIFDFINSTTNIWGKHICLKKVMQENDLKPNNIIYIGDEMRDIEAAKKLGVKVAAVTWGYNSAKALEDSKPDYLLNSPQDLLGLVA